MRNYYFFIVLLGFFVLLIVIGGFYLIGSPSLLAAITYDQKRLSDFQELRYKIESYYHKSYSLPAKLSDLETNTSINTKDRQTKKEYSYQVVTSSSYELCTDFSTDSKETNDKTTRNYYSENMDHKKGYDCISFNLPASATNNPVPIASPTWGPTGNFSDVSAILSQNLAQFNFTFNGNAEKFYVEVSTDPAVLSNVVEEFVTGVASPVENENPLGTWGQYTCNQKVYYRIVALYNLYKEKSPIQQAKVDCKKTINNQVFTSPFTCDQNTLGLWKLDEENADIIVKDTCGSRSGTAYGTKTIKGLFGNGRSFDGKSDYIDLGTNIPAISIKSIEFWAKFNTLTDGQEMVSKSSYSNGIEVLFWNSALSYYVMGGGNDKNIGIPLNQLNTSSYHYIAATQDGPNKEMRLYLDGKLVVSDYAPFFISDAPKLYLGKWTNNGDQRYFNGILDEVRLSSVVRTPDEIQKTYSQPLGTSAN